MGALTIAAILVFKVKTEGVGLTIDQAIHLGFDRARQWRADAQLQHVASKDTDSDVDGSEIPGHDGRRRAWSLQFADPTSHEMIIIETYDHQVRKVLDAGFDDLSGMTPDQIQISGATLARLALQEGLRPGKNWAVGYHYILSYSDASRQFLLAVLGVDKDGQRQVILFDPLTGGPVVPPRLERLQN
jgi:hypothetical protein